MARFLSISIMALIAIPLLAVALLMMAYWRAETVYNEVGQRTIAGEQVPLEEIPSGLATVGPYDTEDYAETFNRFMVGREGRTLWPRGFPSLPVLAEVRDGMIVGVIPTHE